MRIVWLKTEPLHPLDKGGKIRTYHTLRHLRNRHHVTYLTLDDGSAAPEAEALAQEYCHEFVRVSFRPPGRGSLGFYRDLALNLLSPLPFVITRYAVHEMEHALRGLARRGLDLIVCDFLAPSPNLPENLGVPTLLFQHNVEATIWERHTAVSSTWARRLYMRDQWRKMRRYEQAQCLRFDHVVAVSEEDRDAFVRNYGARSVSWVPTGVDTEYFKPKPEAAPRPLEVVFVGSMDWMPNEDGVAWFMTEVLPMIRSSLPDVSFTIVGRSPTPAVEALGREHHAEVTGTVPDVRPFLDRCALVVVPLRVAGGTRLKIYEAMAMEKAVVSTRVGAEGLAARDGVEIRLADEPRAFAESVIGLLKAPSEAARMGRTAAALVREHHGWSVAGEQFALRCEETVHAVQRRQSRMEPAGRLAGSQEKI